MRNSAAGLSLLLILPLLALTSCQTDSSGAPQAQAAPAKPLTHEEAALQCWMATEKPDRAMPLDKRADIVTKCIKDKMNPGHATAAAKPAAKPPAKPPKSKS
jgi:hypothetical protein